LINPQIAFPDGRTSYDGTGYINSGLDVLRQDQGPYILTFTKPGTYDYVCAVHGIVMKGKVIVQESGSALPTDAAGYESLAHDEMVKLIAEAKAMIAAAAAQTNVPAASGPATWDVATGLGGDGHDQGWRHRSLDEQKHRRTAHRDLPGGQRAA
jgi:hypothetical protein